MANAAKRHGAGKEVGQQPSPPLPKGFCFPATKLHHGALASFPEQPLGSPLNKAAAKALTDPLSAPSSSSSAFRLLVGLADMWPPSSGS